MRRATCAAIRRHNTVQQIDVVDLNRAVFELNKHFADSNDAVLTAPRLRLIIDDGRQFLKLTDATYDLVTLEPPPPLNVGISRLYSRAFYADVKDRLAPGGIVTQWLPEDILNRAAVSLITATFVDAFPETLLIAGNNRILVLVGSSDVIGVENVYARLAAEPEVRRDLQRFGIYVDTDALALIMHSPSSMMERWANRELIRDGFLSLESIMLSPVQEIYGSDVFEAEKPELAMDMPALRRYFEERLGMRALPILETIANPEFSAKRFTTVSPFYYAAGDVARSRQQRITAGYDALHDGELESAMAIADDLIRASPAHPDVLTFAGCVYAITGDHDQAAIAFNRVLKVSPRNESAQKLLAHLNSIAERE